MSGVSETLVPARPISDSKSQQKAPPPEATLDEDSSSISTTGLSDSPTEADNIGFAPYVSAMVRFLLDPATTPPLTISVEGRWGSGKSSFLLQVAEKLRASWVVKPAEHPVGRWDLSKRITKFQTYLFGARIIPGGKKAFTIWFNAWRSSKDEALWAAFALTFIRQLGKQIPLSTRVKGNLWLLWKRFDVEKAKWQILQIICFVLAFLALIVVGREFPDLVSEKHQPAAKAATYLSFTSLALWAWLKAKHFLGNPLSRDLSKYIRDLKYDDKISFIDRFQDDFSYMLESYVGDGRVYIFIDDLDRCEVPRAADLMQAINLLLSADQPFVDHSGVSKSSKANLFFLLGMDREIVAAGIAAKNKDVLPYVAGGRFSSTTPGRAGLDYGYAFLEKFIQVPFRVPSLDQGMSQRWIQRLMPPTGASDTPTGLE